MQVLFLALTVTNGCIVRVAAQVPMAVNVLAVVPPGFAPAFARSGTPHKTKDAACRTRDAGKVASFPDFCLSLNRETSQEVRAMSGPDPEERIDATFRNGSLTAAGIILGFSLNFISTWVSNPNDWSAIDILPMLFLVAGIAVQVKVFADLLARDSLIAAKYDRCRRLFLIGLSIVAVGMGIALVNDILGLGKMRLLG
jgi:hypothetical protein